MNRYRSWSRNLLKKNFVSGKLKLGYADIKVSLVLEEDGTIVDDDSYFQALDDHTTLLLLKETESYLEPWETGMKSDKLYTLTYNMCIF